MRARTVLVTGIATVGLTFGLSSPAAADIANANASCPGLGISDHAVNDGPGAISAIVVEIKAAAEFFEFANAGQVVSRFAKEHPGTHDPGCEDAVAAILENGP